MSFNQKTENVILEKNTLGGYSTLNAELDKWEFVANIDILLYEQKRRINFYDNIRCEDVTIQGVIRGTILPNDDLRIISNLGIFRVTEKTIMGNKTIVTLTEMNEFDDETGIEI